MSDLQRFSLATLPVTPWKNGGGSTREIVSWPPGSGLDNFDWRVSIATIAANGPFSVFPGVDRTIMLLEGDGVRLKGDGVNALLDTPHAPYAFSGDVAVDCAVLGGESTDFNLMSRRARGRAELRLVDDLPVCLESIEHGLVMSLVGEWRENGSLLTPGQGVWWASEPHEWRFEPSSRSCKLLTVRWWQSPEI